MSTMYTDLLLDHYKNPRNRGHLESPALSAEEYNPLCGDRVQIQIGVLDGRVCAARFEGHGCAVCLGAASILTEAIEGRTLDELHTFAAEEFLAKLECPVRPARRRCALLPWVAFRRAVFGEAEWP